MIIYTIEFLPDVHQLNQAEDNIVFLVEKRGDAISFKEVIFNLHVNIEDMPKYLIDAVISREDKGFYDHHGVSLTGIARAIFKHHGGSGGSTITQQVARSLFLSTNRNYIRKVKEILLAIKIEIYYSKLEILEMYLNNIYLGNGTRGVETAARYYFSKRAKDLTLWEASLLVGSFPNPRKRNYKYHKDIAERCAVDVIHKMKKHGFIENNEKIFKSIRKGKKVLYRTDHICLFDAVVPEIKKISKIKNTKDGSLFVLTSFNPELQVYAELSIKKRLDTFKKLNVSEAAFIALDTSGAIKAMVGSLDRKKSTFNHAVQAKNQMGSVFKPVVYLSAIENGWKMSRKISGKHISVNGWSPKNNNHQYPSSITLEKALYSSCNTATVRLMEKVGRKNIIKTAKKLGFNDSSLPDNPTLALGTGEATLRDITKIYSVFASGGQKISPYTINGIRDGYGTILYWRTAEKENVILDEKYVHDINKALREVIQKGTGRKAAVKSVQVAGKTGTTQNNRDAWFVGFSAHLVAGVWLGNRDNSPMKNVSGSGLPAEIWSHFMTNAYYGLGLPKDKPLP
ncbi:transglycosylase domain-containing protein [Candidatus Electronema sp. JC]|uniref:transglycosylase domain-containing protein n=1 Tax=Candidatus Electronema sp. JC TaxID=3401570 RepID=UPI003B4367AC